MHFRHGIFISLNLNVGDLGNARKTIIQYIEDFRVLLKNINLI